MSKLLIGEGMAPVEHRIDGVYEPYGFSPSEAGAGASG
jgi:hypothetical protein